eukprot:gene11557-7964_t
MSVNISLSSPSGHSWQPACNMPTAQLRDLASKARQLLRRSEQSQRDHGGGERDEATRLDKKQENEPNEGEGMADHSGAGAAGEHPVSRHHRHRSHHRSDSRDAAAAELHRMERRVQQCVKDGAQVMYRSTAAGLPILISFIEQENVPCVRLCLETEASIDFTVADTCGHTALHYICMVQSTEKAVALLQCVVDRQRRCRDKDTIYWGEDWPEVQERHIKERAARKAAQAKAEERRQRELRGEAPQTCFSSSSDDSMDNSSTELDGEEAAKRAKNSLVWAANKGRLALFYPIIREEPYYQRYRESGTRIDATWGAIRRRDWEALSEEDRWQFKRPHHLKNTPLRRLQLAELHSSSGSTILTMALPRIELQRVAAAAFHITKSLLSLTEGGGMDPVVFPCIIQRRRFGRLEWNGLRRSAATAITVVGALHSHSVRLPNIWESFWCRWCLAIFLSVCRCILRSEGVKTEQLYMKYIYSGPHQIPNESIGAAHWHTSISIFSSCELLCLPINSERTPFGQGGSDAGSEALLLLGIAFLSSRPSGSPRSRSIPAWVSSFAFSWCVVVPPPLTVGLIFRTASEEIALHWIFAVSNADHEKSATATPCYSIGKLLYCSFSIIFYTAPLQRLSHISSVLSPPPLFLTHHQSIRSINYYGWGARAALFCGHDRQASGGGCQAGVGPAPPPPQRHHDRQGDTRPRPVLLL